MNHKLAVINIKETMLNFLFPKSCVNCGRFGEYVCEVCLFKYFNARTTQECHVCKKLVIQGFVHSKCTSETNLDGVIVCLNYAKQVEKLLSEFKYKLNFDLAGFISKFYKCAYQTFLDDSFSNFILVPVPLFRNKEWKRGFNQIDLISNYLSKEYGLKKIKVLKRIRLTKTQVGLSKSEREKNLENAFEFQKVKGRENKKVILIDDIMTTGTTLEECAQILKINGVDQVYAMVLTRG